jgi:Ca2+-binding EF-hand superfamily protein
MHALDTDKDGELSAEEIANAPAALKTLDKDGDGKLNREELRPPRPGPEVFAQRLMNHDKDGDGKVSKEELPERMQRMFDRADTNADGFIDQAEATQFAEEMGKRGGQKKAGEKRSKKSRRSRGE